MAQFADPIVFSESHRPVFLGLGANLGDRESNLISALEGLVEAGLGLIAVSSCYQTVPQGGPPGQADYLNLACQVEYSRSPLELLAVCRHIEARLGRVRKDRWEARSIDVDILLMGSRVIVRSSLLVPHPRMLSRAFVMIPLAEIAGTVVHPTKGMTISALQSELEPQESVKRHPWRASSRAALPGMLPWRSIASQ